MNVAHTVANCFMGLVAFLAVTAQTALASGMILA
jgi:hypothetical protein